MNKKKLILTLALALPATLALAQRPGGGPPPGPPPAHQPQQGGTNSRNPQDPPPQQDGTDGPQQNPNGQNPPPRPMPPQPMPLLNALDIDRDGIISAEEIKTAPDALKKLDKNHDGKLTPDEYFGPRPDGPPPGDRGDGDRRPRTRTTISEKNLPPEPFPGTKGEARKKPAAPKDGDGADKRPDGPPAGGDRPPHRPPPPPLVAALDADGDGVISADEIANAATALLTLDKNGDGQLGPGEYMGHPPGDHPEGRPPVDPLDNDGPRPPRPPPEGQ